MANPVEFKAVRIPETTFLHERFMIMADGVHIGNLTHHTYTKGSFRFDSLGNRKLLEAVDGFFASFNVQNLKDMFLVIKYGYNSVNLMKAK